MRMQMVVALGMAGVVATATHGVAGSMPERRAPMLVPKTDHEVVRAQVYAVFPRAEGQWGAVHVVDRTCSISRAVIAHLVERRASSELEELVIVIDREGATTREDVELVHAGYRVRVLSRANASEVVPAVTPMMFIARPDGTLAYAGGHRVMTQRAVAQRVVTQRAVAQRVVTQRAVAQRAATVVAQGAATPGADGFIDTVVIGDLVATGTTDVAAQVVGCADDASTTLVRRETKMTPVRRGVDRSTRSRTQPPTSPTRTAPTRSITKMSSPRPLRLCVAVPGQQFRRSTDRRDHDTTADLADAR